ncbi:ankyrin repeat domain-containing protein [Paenibacillus luteus]|uniref:ankyrin repeat domain-containing protein n=1 Tax=Paenibacillus luteus TaxID=2545753 RepID=UPI001142DAC3|nr:ankyrin repeat domain-containing protein [Paenibacillus luteus]
MKKIILFVLVCLLAGCTNRPNVVEEDVTFVGKAFIEAAERGETEKVLQYLKDGIDINVRDDRGRTAILAATHRNRVDTVQALRDAGADLNLQDDRLDNPLLYAGAEGKLEIVKLMNEAGADPAITNRFGGTALIPASEHGYVEVVEELLKNSSIDVNHINNLGWTALMEAIVLSDGDEKQQQVIQLLIEHGADVNIPDKEGITPLEHAKARQFAAIERLLLDAGA